VSTLTDGVIGGSGAETGKVGQGSKGISGIATGIKGEVNKARSSSGYPGVQDSSPDDSDKKQSAP